LYLNNPSILDINECDNASFCPPEADHGVCQNTVGNYTCACKTGYTLNETTQCEGKYIFER